MSDQLSIYDILPYVIGSMDHYGDFSALCSGNLLTGSQAHRVCSPLAIPGLID